MKKIDICICTYKRPDLLAKLLDSINNCQPIKDINLRIIIVDNDSQKSAKLAVTEFRKSSGQEVIYSVEQKQNISAARNRCLKISAESDYIIFVDDDEWVSRSWLTHLINAQESYSADIIIGPVITKYSEDTPEWVVKSKVFDRERKKTGDNLHTGNTGNALISKRVFQTIKGFDLGYGLSGGEDSEFFRRAKAAGAVMVWCNEAETYEYLAKDRMSLTYIYKRANRCGQTTAILNKENLNKLKLLGYLLKKCIHVLIAGGLVILTTVFGKQHSAKWISKLAGSIGHISGLFGKKRNMY